MIRAFWNFYVSIFPSKPQVPSIYKPSRLTVPLLDPEVVAKIFHERWDKDLITKQEQVYAIYVDEEYKMIKHVHLHTGGPRRCYIDKYLLFKHAFDTDAYGFFLAHSHKREVLQASPNDKRTTCEIKKISEGLDIKFLDHIIITPKSYFSFSEEKLLD